MENGLGGKGGLCKRESQSGFESQTVRAASKNAATEKV